MSSQTFCNLDKFCVNETEESSFKSAICYSQGLKKKKFEDVLLLPEKENKVFEVSKSEGDSIKGLVTNTEPFRTERDPN